MYSRWSIHLIFLYTCFLVVSNQTLSTSKTTLKTEDSCGDWESYKNEKCFKLFPNLNTYDNAIHLCRAQSSYATLASVRSKEEQEFIQNLVFGEHNSVDSVWIGGNKNNSNHKFQWEDGSEFSYSNWDDSGFDKAGNDCIEMQTEIGYANSNRLGKWIQVSCEKRNLVLCQFIQNWSTSRIETTFLDFKIRVEATFDKLNNEIKSLKSSESTSVPIGFVYFQLPAQPEPQTIWTSSEWEDISKSYAGLFFRVLGGNSSTFGNVQDSDSPQMTDIEEHSTGPTTYSPTTYSPTTTSSPLPIVKKVSLCYYSCNSHQDLIFKFSNTEVRPRNQAIRVWKRTK